MRHPQPALSFFYQAVDTDFGPFAVIWWSSKTGPRVRRIILCGERAPEACADSVYPGQKECSCQEIAELGGRMRRFLKGEDVKFDLNWIALEECAAFQRQVLLAEYAIPRGRISTYGRIAKHIGAPLAGRAVGRALAENPFPIVIPCHRAVRADGGVGGYQGGGAMKRALLEMEGVEFIGSGRVSLSRVFY
jgi:methylated-DNA-[protein]-cysteine S-methyltransferase